MLKTQQSHLIAGKNAADAVRLSITGVSAMKVRIRFSKTGALVYIGHLDVMRYFQKLFRRSGIPVAYTEGFSPHQILSFSHPLPLGMESAGEYADVELTCRITSGLIFFGTGIVGYIPAVCLVVGNVK